MFTRSGLFRVSEICPRIDLNLDLTKVSSAVYSVYSYSLKISKGQFLEHPKTHLQQWMTFSVNSLEKLRSMDCQFPIWKKNLKTSWLWGSLSWTSLNCITIKLNLAGLLRFQNMVHYSDWTLWCPNNWPKYQYRTNYFLKYQTGNWVFFYQNCFVHYFLSGIFRITRLGYCFK